jgi:hypothetical protein
MSAGGPGTLQGWTAVGSMDAENVVGPWRALADSLSARDHEDLEYQDEVFAGETHISVFPLSVVHGLKFLFPAAR